MAAVTAPRWSACEPPLSEVSQEVLSSLGFRYMTPVQAATIPLFTTFKDVCVQACTGSGKTLAFVVPIVEILLRREGALRPHQVGAVVISPTRELAVQIWEVASHFMAKLPQFKAVLVVGGSDVAADVAQFRPNSPQAGCNVVVATPGRLEHIIDTLGQQFDARELEVLVLDEADRLLEMGFAMTLSNILKRLPKQRRTGLFSATQTEEVASLARAGLRNPYRVAVSVSDMSAFKTALQHTTTSAHMEEDCDDAPADAKTKVKKLKKKKKKKAGAEPDAPAEVEDAADAVVDDAADALADPSSMPDQKTPLTLRNMFVTVNNDEKLAALISLLLKHGSSCKILVFFITCACVDFFDQILSELPVLKQAGIEIASLHGKQVSKKRTAVYRKFSSSPNGVLLCTDVAARGLDISNVDWVVQFDPPQDPDYFVHRVGRTARMGEAGNALLFLLPNEGTYVDFLKVRRIPMEEVVLDNAILSCPDDAKEFQDRIYKQVTTLVSEDRALVEKNVTAYVSYVRAYRNHQCGYIFRLQQLDPGSLARALGLLQLPKMPELQGLTLAWSPPFPDLDVRNVPFKDRLREKQRLNKVKKIDKREDKKEKNANKPDKRAAAGPVGSVISSGKRGASDAFGPTQSDDSDSDDDFAKEANLLKKFKSGKISKKEFERAMGEAEDSDDELPDQQVDNKEKLVEVIEKKIENTEDADKGMSSEDGDDSDDDEVDDNDVNLNEKQTRKVPAFLKSLEARKAFAARMSSKKK